jgi:hypothetical protein
MYQLENTYHGTGFPPLELADKVPGDPLTLEGLNLGKGLLEAVFTGDLHSCVDGFADAVDCDRFGCRHQPHFALVPANLLQRAPDSIEHRRETILD